MSTFRSRKQPRCELEAVFCTLEASWTTVMVQCSGAQVRACAWEWESPRSLCLKVASRFQLFEVAPGVCPFNTSGSSIISKLISQFDEMIN
jgi:hypothetical protein